MSQALKNGLIYQAKLTAYFTSLKRLYIPFMSYLLEEDIECPHCHLPNPVEVWSILSVKEDPELKDLLLGGELNMAECASCHAIFFAEHFLIYHDPDQELMAFVYPYSYRDQKEVWEEKTKVDFELTHAVQSDQVQITYQPLTMFGINELVQLVQKEEEWNIQSEVVSTLAALHDFPVTKISPSRAQEVGMPPVLPLEKNGEGDQRQALIHGLENLLRINPHLFVYSDLLKRLTENEILHVNV